MRFRFCGDLDCPDWLLAEVAAMAQLEKHDMSIIATEVLSFILKRAGDGFVDGTECAVNLVEKLPSISVSHLEGFSVAVHFMLTNSAKHNVDSSSLSQEIMQLGMDREHAAVIKDIYENNKEEFRRIAADTSYRLNRLMKAEWRIDQILVSSNSDEGEYSEEKVAVVKLTLDRGTLAFEINEDRLDILLYELSNVRTAM
jgi:COMM domain containing 4